MFQRLSLPLYSGGRWRGGEPIFVGLLHIVSLAPLIDQSSLHMFIEFLT